MTAPPLPSDEAGRLRALVSYAILDTPPEAEFDELAKVAAEICGTPVALVSLVDETRQWVKAQVGFDRTEMPREISFCGYALAAPNLFVVPDAAQDERFADHPLVAGESGVRFYAGAPLRSPEGHAIGTLCVMDFVPRELAPQEYSALRALGRQVVAQLEIRRLQRVAEAARKRAEWALHESEERLRTVSAHMTEGLIIARADGEVIHWNPAALAMYGFTSAEEGSRRLPEFTAIFELSLVDGTVIPFEEWPMSRLFRGETLRDIELRIRRPGDGWTRIFRYNGALVREPNGERVAFLTVTDVSARHRMESRMRRLIQSNEQGVTLANDCGKITEANDAFLQMVGYSREDLLAGRIKWDELTPPEFAQMNQHAAEELATKGVCAPFEKEYLRKDGTRVPVMVGIASMPESPGENVSFVVDLTERKRLEQQFLRAQRLESIGTLAGGIAHDLNNVLGPIIMSVDLLQLKVTDRYCQELLGIVSTSAQRGADMVRQVLSFARGMAGQRLDVQIRHLVRDIERIVHETFLKHVEMRTIIAHDLWTVVGDATQLQQVLLNLCVNARDAMPGGGTLAIFAENVHLDANYAGLNIEAKPGAYVLVQVEDSGTGMPPEILDKIFDPFFTTKEIGKGTGLGLSTTLAIVKSHGGFIKVYSEPGSGTTFKIYLPANPEGSEGAAEMKADMPRGNGEMILVVDDEASVRQITEQTLQAFGYRVIVACDGAEALTIYAQRQAEIDLVVTDMMMPVMAGSVLISVLQRMNPRLPIIAVSGLSTNADVARVTGVGIKSFLFKPYTADTLLQALKKALAGTGEG